MAKKYCYNTNMKTDNFWIFTDDEKRIIRSIIAKGKAEEAVNDKFAIISIADFYALYNDEERAIIDKYKKIDPVSFDYKLPYLGIVDVADDIVTIPNQKYTERGKQYIVTQYLPRPVFAAYDTMNLAMQKQIPTGIKIRHGYRSLARQFFLFFDLLERKCDFDFDKAISRVCFAAYSEHVCPSRQAIDFMTDEGVCDGFELTDKYQWLQSNAVTFGFYESYPKDNPLGMMYEPWHWHFEAKI